MLMFLAAAAVAIFIGIAAFVLIAPERVWSLFGPVDFAAVGFWYERFDQTSDSEVLRLLDRAAEASRTGT